MGPPMLPCSLKKAARRAQGESELGRGGQMPEAGSLNHPGQWRVRLRDRQRLDEDGETLTFVLARTWLSEDQLRDEQRFAVVGQELGTRLGDNVLLPIPPRHLATTSKVGVNPV